MGLLAVLQVRRRSAESSNMSRSATLRSHLGVTLISATCVALLVTMLVSSCGTTSWTQVVSGGDRVSVGSSGLSLVMPTGGGYIIKGHQEGGTKYLDEVVFGNRPPLWLVSAHVMSFPHISDWPLALFLVHGQVIAQSADGSVVIYWGSKGGPFKPFLVLTHLKGRAYGAILDSKTFDTPAAVWNQAARIWHGLDVQGATLPPLGANTG